MTDRPRRLTELPPAMESAWSPIPKRGTKQARFGGERMLCNPPPCRCCPATSAVEPERLMAHAKDAPYRINFDKETRHAD